MNLSFFVSIGIFTNTFIYIVPFCIVCKGSASCYPTCTLTIYACICIFIRNKEGSCCNIQSDICRIWEVPDYFLTDFLVYFLIMFRNNTLICSICFYRFVRTVNYCNIIFIYNYTSCLFIVHYDNSTRILFDMKITSTCNGRLQITIVIYIYINNHIFILWI